MLDVNRFAFKEWAVVCAALAEGRQTLLVRKGGIHERSGRFAVEHDEFWLFPTRFHQDPDELCEDARPLLKTVASDAPPAGALLLSLYAVVDEIIVLQDESRLSQLSGLQVLAEPTIRERFHYRTPGLFVLPARISRLPKPVVLADSPHFAGCRTWVDLQRDLPTAALRPVLDSAAHREQVSLIRSALTS